MLVDAAAAVGADCAALLELEGAAAAADLMLLALALAPVTAPRLVLDIEDMSATPSPTLISLGSCPEAAAAAAAELALASRMRGDIMRSRTDFCLTACISAEDPAALAPTVTAAVAAAAVERGPEVDRGRRALVAVASPASLWGGTLLALLAPLLGARGRAGCMKGTRWG